MHRRITSPENLEAVSRGLAAERDDGRVLMTVCGGPGCQASRCHDVASEIRKQVKDRELEKKIRLRVTGCHGFCEQGPIVLVGPEKIFYCRVKQEDVREILDHAANGGGAVERLLYTDPDTGRTVIHEADVPFYRAQTPDLLLQNRQVDPLSIEDYLAIGGYSALGKILAGMEPEKVIQEVTDSGLRGLGGAGFPTGRKWAACRAAYGEEKYVVCNADEGDPGAFMDRGILEGNPHAVIEGMIIGAWAIGAQEGYIYVRNEYPIAVEHARIAVGQARDYGFLGANILGSGLDFDISITRGAGAFVCGESTALMVSLEGKVGEPRPKDVEPVERGLWNKPTTVNNVETWANIPSIIRKGAGWFAGIGTEKSKGTKILALTGQVRNTGLVEVAFGTTIRTIVEDIGGGGLDGKKIKAVQTGGPSGGCLPESMFDLPVDFDLLQEKGSMVGSGGLVVLDEDACMVDVAKYFLKFLQDESCGKCVPCRIGVSRLLEIVTDITEGRGKPEYLDLLEDLGETVAQTSLCGLGKTAPNPVLSTLKYFRDEYEAHINEKRCPAHICKALIRYVIDPDKCNGCMACLSACPSGAIHGEKKQVHTIDTGMCDKCGICVTVCGRGAISVQ
ncbi:MAG: NADH-quinone oxidoreductase subunit NuoF [Proteobacteria bacterium]|nr:NADH-quinone oxidoreductase subunit NuoF [Pseudomonadota bacterium]